jgi:hypothetical protein
MWRETYVSAKETYVSAKETYVSAKETYVSAKETYVGAQHVARGTFTDNQWMPQGRYVQTKNGEIWFGFSWVYCVNMSAFRGQSAKNENI